MINLSLNPSLTDNFTKALSYYRTVTGKKNRDIASAIGVPETTFSSWSNGKHLPDMEKLQKLADYLNAPIQQFFSFSIPQEDKALKELISVASELPDEDKDLLRIVALKIKK